MFKLCPPSLIGLNNLERIKVSISFLLERSTFINLLTTGTSKPIILWPINVSADWSNSRPDSSW